MDTHGGLCHGQKETPLQLKSPRRAFATPIATAARRLEPPTDRFIPNRLDFNSSGLTQQELIAAFASVGRTYITSKVNH